MDSIWGMGVDDVVDWSTRRSEGGGFHALEHNLIVVAVTLLVITGASMIRCPEPKRPQHDRRARRPNTPLSCALMSCCHELGSMAILPATSFAGRWVVAQVARANAPLFLIHTFDHVSIPPTWPARGHMCAVMMALLFLPMCLFSNPQTVPQASDTVFYYVDIICLEFPH